MGLSSSKDRLDYVIGVYKEPQKIKSDVDREFTTLVDNVKSKLKGNDISSMSEAIKAAYTYRASKKYADYVQTYRSTMSSKYSELEENQDSVGIPDSYIRDKLILIIDNYSQKVAAIDGTLYQDCDIKGFCPRHVIDPDTGQPRELQPLDHIHPCQLRSCMKEQLESQLEKYKRWVVNMQWAGDTAKSASELENVPITRDGMLEMLYRLQQTVLWSIEAASEIRSVGEEKARPTKTERVYNVITNTRHVVSGSTSALHTLIIIAVVILILIAVIYFLAHTIPAASMIPAASTVPAVGVLPTAH